MWELEYCWRACGGSLVWGNTCTRPGCASRDANCGIVAACRAVGGTVFGTAFCAPTGTMAIEMMHAAKIMERILRETTLPE